MNARPQYSRWCLCLTFWLVSVPFAWGQTRVTSPMLQPSGCVNGQCGSRGPMAQGACPGGYCGTASGCANGQCGLPGSSRSDNAWSPLSSSARDAWEPIASDRRASEILGRGDRLNHPQPVMGTNPGDRSMVASGSAEFPELPATPGGRWSPAAFRSGRTQPSDAAERLIAPGGYSVDYGRTQPWGFDRPAGGESRFRPTYRGGGEFPAIETPLRPDFNPYHATPDRSNGAASGSDRGLDPFVPSQIPRDQMGGENQAIFNEITARYQNPVSVRTVRSMSPDQALRLFQEVSARIDERHLEPSSYDLRVRRGLRNLALALDNPTFLQSLGVSTDSFRVDAFRNTLNRLSGSVQVTSASEAASVVQAVMREAQTVAGLSPSVVAYEFANASIDTLDKFSALEPADPAMGAGAALDNGYRTASLEENMVGLGIEVRQDDAGLLVTRALREGPAASSGIESGDLIVAIDGRSIAGLPMSGSVDLLKGAEGSQSILRVRRGGRGERNFTVVRRRFRIWTVNDTRIIPDTNVAYLTLNKFAKNSTSELDQALTRLHQQGMKSVIIDLRGNPGGLLTTCVEISDRFLPCGTIVSTRGRLSEDNMVESATRSRTWSTPLVVLVDGDSASASEIFAAAVQDNRRGVIVGSQSYGKGTVQTHFPLNTVSGNLRLTTARFYSPNGRAMAGSGVTPDVQVTDADGPVGGDQVLERAIEIAQSRELAEMAQAAGTTCRTGSPSAARSSSLDHLRNIGDVTTTVR